MSALNGTHLLAEAAGKESTKAGPVPAVYVDNECDLDPILLVDKVQVVLCLEGKENSREVVCFRIYFSTSPSLTNIVRSHYRMLVLSLLGVIMHLLSHNCCNIRLI